MVTETRLIAICFPRGAAKELKTWDEEMPQSVTLPLFDYIARNLPLDPMIPNDGLVMHLNELKLHDLVSEKSIQSSFSTLGHSDIAYQSVFRDRDLSIALWFLREGAHIPMHDHPSMRVHAKCMKGQIRVEDGEGRQLVVREEGTFVVTPENNLHEVWALEDTIFLDIMYPPYTENCNLPNFYRRNPHGDVVRTQVPAGFTTQNLPYDGVPFLRKSTLN